jgi:hypothetical protein
MTIRTHNHHHQYQSYVVNIVMSVESFCAMALTCWPSANIISIQLTRIAGVAQSVQCLTTDWTAGVRSPTEAEDFSSTLCVQTGSGAHPASCTMGTGGSFPGGKALPGRDADHSPPSRAEVKKG